jgi:predicted DNA-binding protein YlxM (UPF0122 family)
MSKQKHLTKKQLAVIDDLFESDLKESEILKKYKVSRTLYNRWLADEKFIKEFDNRIAAAYKRNVACIAVNTSKAINTLLTMIDADKGELTRKACLDLIELQNQRREKNLPQQQLSESNTCLSDEAAGRILAALAEER